MKKAFVFQIFEETNMFGETEHFKELVEKFASIEMAQEWILKQIEPREFYIMTDERIES